MLSKAKHLTRIVKDNTLAARARCFASLSMTAFLILKY
jgi:hypothetical protein